MQVRTRFCKQWRSKGGKWGHTVLSAALGAHQHTLQSFKNIFLSKNLNFNTLKNA